MRSQALLIEALVVFLIVVTALFLFVPLHQDVSSYVKAVIRNDEAQVGRLLGH